METKTITRTFLPPGGTLNIDLYGGTLTNNSAFPITVEGSTVAPGATINLNSGDASVSVLCTQPAQVTVAYTTNTSQSTSIGSVTLDGPVQIGSNAPTLAAIRLLCSKSLAFGITYYDENAERTGNSASLTVNAGGGVPVALPSVPNDAVTAKLVHSDTDSVTLYVDVQGANTSAPDFQTNYLRYPRKLVTASVGTSLGA